MTEHDDAVRRSAGYPAGEDSAPGLEIEGEGRPDLGAAVRGYVIGLALAVLATVASFAVAGGYGMVWTPAIPMALAALAVGQMGVHLVFFLHITTGPDNTNNILALAFGTLIVGLVLVGSLWIMGHVDHHLMSAAEMARMQR